LKNKHQVNDSALFWSEKGFEETPSTSNEKNDREEECPLDKVETVVND
jgi:hypothetical protein